MANNDNIIYAKFNHSHEIVTDSRSQYAYGQVLKISGLHLPASFDADISNKGDKQAKVVIGTDNELPIDDAFFLSGKDVIVMINVHAADKDGRTKYIIRIPVEKRPERADIELEPVEQDVVSTAIAALNEAVEQTSANAESAENSASRAQQSAIDAETSATNASNSEALVQQYMERAETAAENAEQSETKAKTSEDNAKASEEHAEQIATEIEQYTERAETASTNAQSSASTATQKATEASAFANIATTKANEASTSATNAQNSADNAQQSATSAQTSANSASASASKALVNAEKTQSDKEIVELAKSNVLSAVGEAQTYATTAQSASQAIQDMSVEAVTLEVDSDVTVEKSVDPVTGAVTLTYGIPKGVKGEKGDTGSKGDKGDPFVYSDFTPEQLASLKGEKGDKGDQGIQGIQGERGIQGEQGIQGVKGDTGEKGDKGDAFTYVDFTPEQLASLKGAKGDKGDAFEYSDFTPEQLASLKGEKGDTGSKGDKGDTGDVTLEEFYKVFPTDTATGAVASFPDGADNIPMADVKVNIEPVQDLHGQENPYPAGGGKNKANVSDYSQSFTNVYYADKAMGVTLEAGVTYTFSCDVNSTVTPFAISAGVGSSGAYRRDILTKPNQDNGRNYITFTPTAEQLTDYTELYVRIPRFFAPQTGTVSVSNIQLESGSTATAFAPYSNICPISGWNGANVSRIGKNWFDLKKFAEVYPQNCSYNETTGELSINSISDLFYVGIPTDIPLDISNGGFMQWEAMNGTGTNFRFRLIYSDGTMDDLNGTGTTTGYIKYAKQTAAKRITSIRMNWSKPGTFTIKNVCITQGTNDVPYKPYTGNLYPITFPTEAGTVYGGTLDVTTGVLTVDRANIANYNSEILPSTWISDRDVYSAGATPTTGAQVVYELAEPIHYTLDPVEIRSILGQNNVFADTGNTTAEYRASTKLYIQKKITEAVSALT